MCTRKATCAGGDRARHGHVVPRATLSQMLTTVPEHARSTTPDWTATRIGRPLSMTLGSTHIKPRLDSLLHSTFRQSSIPTCTISSDQSPPTSGHPSAAQLAPERKQDDDCRGGTSASERPHSNALHPVARGPSRSGGAGGRASRWFVLRHCWSPVKRAAVTQWAGKTLKNLIVKTRPSSGIVARDATIFARSIYPLPRDQGIWLGKLSEIGPPRGLPRRTMCGRGRAVSGPRYLNFCARSV